MTMLSTVGVVRGFCYNFVLLDNSWPQRWGAEWRQADLTSDPGNWPAPDIWAGARGPWGHRRILVTPSSSSSVQSSSHCSLSLMMTADHDMMTTDHTILTWGRYWCILCLSVTSQGGERSVTVYCRSLVRSLQSPAWGQLRARVRSEESLNWSEDRELESGNNSREGGE